MKKVPKKKNPNIFFCISNGKPTSSAYCYECKSKKIRFIQEQETKRLLRSLGLKAPLTKVPILGSIHI